MDPVPLMLLRPDSVGVVHCLGPLPRKAINELVASGRDRMLL